MEQSRIIAYRVTLERYRPTNWRLLMKLRSNFLLHLIHWNLHSDASQVISAWFLEHPSCNFSLFSEFLVRTKGKLVILKTWDFHRFILRIVEFLELLEKSLSLSLLSYDTSANQTITRNSEVEFNVLEIWVLGSFANIQGIANVFIYFKYLRRNKEIRNKIR